MIEAYASGDAIPITHPSDKANPTVFWVYPVTDRMLNRFNAIGAWVRRKEKEAHPEETIEAIIEASDKQSERQLSMLATWFDRVENAPPGGVTITGMHDIVDFLGKLQTRILTDLMNAMIGETRLRDLTFRGDPVPGSAERTEQG